MIASVTGPATTARRAVTDPEKSASPQPVTQPTATSIAAAAAMLQAGRYTRDDRAAVGRLSTRSLRSTAPSTGERTSVTTADMTSPREATVALERDTARAGVAALLRA